MRRVLLRCIVVVALFAVLAFIFKDEVFWVIFAPKSPDFLPFIFGSSPEVQLINTELTRQFVVHMMTSLYVGIIVAAPYIIFELYRFISPGLYENERHYTTPLVIASYFMFMMGILFCYFILFPITFRFLANYQVDTSIQNLISLESYIDTLVFLSLAMGIIFEIPILSAFSIASRCNNTAVTPSSSSSSSQPSSPPPPMPSPSPSSVSPCTYSTR